MDILSIVSICLIALTLIVELVKVLFIGRKLTFICKYCGRENVVEEKPLMHYVIGGSKIQAENLEDAVKQFNEAYLNILERR